MATYPEAKGVRRYDVDAFLAVQGLAFYNGSVVTTQVKREKQHQQQLRVAEERKRAAAAERDRLIYTDPQTGLIWVRNGNIAGKEMNWENAKSWVKNLNYGGYSGWRLPTKHELASFAKRGGNSPSAYFNANGFNAVQAGWYWSGTEYDDNRAWVVHVKDGTVDYSGKRVDVYVWAVRSGQ